MIALAANEGVPLLYHYQPGNLAWIEDVLVNRRIRLSNPSQFNDPWDCSPYFNTAADHQQRELDVSFFVQADRKCFPKPEHVHKGMENCLWNDPKVLPHLVASVNAEVRAAIGARFRVYCLSTTAVSHLMWAHYADKHRGVCLEFGTNNSVFSGALRVIYEQQQRPLTLGDRSMEGNLLPFLTKPGSWDYEKEFRIIAQERIYADPPDTLITDDGYLAIPAGALKSIIVGCEASRDFVDQLQDTLHGVVRKPTLRRAVRVPGQYDLRISD